MNTAKKRIPKFKDEKEEQLFWAKADSTDYIDWSQAKPVKLPNLKPTLKTISLRLPACRSYRGLKDSRKSARRPLSVLAQTLLDRKNRTGTHSIKDQVW